MNGNKQLVALTVLLAGLCMMVGCEADLNKSLWRGGKYINSRFGMEIDVPSDVILTEGNNLSAHTVSFHNTQDGRGARVAISYSEHVKLFNYLGVSMRRQLQQMVNSLKKDDNFHVTREGSAPRKYILKGVYSQSPQIRIEITHIILVIGRRIYLVSAEVERNHNYDRNKSLTEQMVDSLKFYEAPDL